MEEAGSKGREAAQVTGINTSNIVRWEEDAVCKREKDNGSYVNGVLWAKDTSVPYGLKHFILHSITT